jgi:hypothetical protein
MGDTAKGGEYEIRSVSVGARASDSDEVSDLTRCLTRERKQTRRVAPICSKQRVNTLRHRNHVSRTIPTNLQAFTPDL